MASKQKQYTCDVCEKTFTQKSHLSIHARTHTGEKPYKCDVCGKAFSHRNALLIHGRTHTGEKPYKCDVCGKVCTQAHHLTRHYRTHTGEKPYTCDVCGKAFSERANLNSHVRTHTGETPYKCDVCGEAFMHWYNLRSHVTTHTGVKPYKCDSCEKAFTRSSILRRHMKTHEENGHMAIKEYEKQTIGKDQDACISIDNLTSIKVEDCGENNVIDHCFIPLFVVKEHALNQMKCEEQTHATNQNGLISTYLVKCEAQTENAEISDTDQLCDPLIVVKENMRMCEVQNRDTSRNELLSMDNVKVEVETDSMCSSTRINDVHNNMDPHFEDNEPMIMKHEAPDNNTLKSEAQWQDEWMSAETVDDTGSNDHAFSQVKVEVDVDVDVDTAQYKVEDGVIQTLDGTRQNIDQPPISEVSDEEENTSTEKRKCHMCPEIFETAHEYKLHRQQAKHKFTNKYACHVCNQTFNKVSLLNNHVKTHPNARPYKCTVCDVKFAFSSTLKKHMKIHPSSVDLGSKIFSCGVCLEEFSNEESVSLHCNTHTSTHKKTHISGETHMCPVCKKTFTSAGQLQFHAYSEHTMDTFGTSLELKKPPFYQCYACRKTFTSVPDFENHIISHSDTLVQPLNCGVCDMKFTFKKNLEKHRSTHTQTHSKLFLQQRQELNIQLNRENARHNNFSHDCHVCKQTFGNASLLNTHLLKHPIDMARPYKCTICLVQFAYSSTLEKHMEIYHSTAETGQNLLQEHEEHRQNTDETTSVQPECFYCNICKGIFANAEILHQHYESHNGDTFKCDTSGSEFKSKTCLAKHKKFHSKEAASTVRPESHERAASTFQPAGHESDKFRCETCGRTFKSKGSLARHIRSHTYRCELCKMNFTTPDFLQHHEQVNCAKRVKPHKCDICGQGFNFLDTLKRHLDLHWQKTCTGPEGTMWKCSICKEPFSLEAHGTKHSCKRLYLFKCSKCGAVVFDNETYPHKCGHRDEQGQINKT